MSYKESNMEQLKRMLKEAKTRKSRKGINIFEGIFNTPPIELDEPGYDTQGDYDIDQTLSNRSQENKQGVPDMKGVFARIRKEIINGIAMLASYPESAE